MKTKRKRGGQPGNQNARKHGFYSCYLNSEDFSELQKALDPGNIEPDIAFTRIKLRSDVGLAPGNSRVVADAARRMIKKYLTMYAFEKKGKKDI